MLLCGGRAGFLHDGGEEWRRSYFGEWVSGGGDPCVGWVRGEVGSMRGRCGEFEVECGWWSAVEAGRGLEKREEEGERQEVPPWYGTGADP